MELYFKDLISEEASLERLVDDLELVVQGANDLAKAAGIEVPRQSADEVAGQLSRLKAQCRRLRQQAKSGARAADRALRQHPYSCIGVAFALGLLVGLRVPPRKSIYIALPPGR